MEISIYHISRGNLVSAVTRILEKVYLSGERCVFSSPVEERTSFLDRALWTFTPLSFVPHGNGKSGFCDQQPIYFTTDHENPNKAKVLLLMDTFDFSAWYDQNIFFEKIILMFEDESQIALADALYKNLKNEKRNVNYWKQSYRGWEKID
ncbi:MAG: DNA polymerase III subunit chi [Holosporaceae bacterium]|nr:DNA polymerase III subunit chi [Holosporaceae bacterium]